MKKEEIQKQVEAGGNKNVITFIYDVLYHSGEDGIEPIRNLYANGYCYYFARMLEDAFPGGKVCVAWPFGHIVYIYKDVAYDIDGISIAEYDQFIPVDFLGFALDDFRHNGKVYGTAKEEVDEIGKRWKSLGTTIEALTR